MTRWEGLMASGTDLQNESTGARRLSDTRQAIPTLGTELQSKQAPQKLRAWGDGGKKLSLPLPPTTGHGLDPWGPPPARQPGQHRAIHNKTEGSPPYKPGPLQRHPSPHTAAWQLFPSLQLWRGRTVVARSKTNLVWPQNRSSGIIKTQVCFSRFPIKTN